MGCGMSATSQRFGLTLPNPDGVGPNVLPPLDPLKSKMAKVEYIRVSSYFHGLMLSSPSLVGQFSAQIRLCFEEGITKRDF